MDPSSKQWRSLGDAASPAEALLAVRALLRDDAVTHGWANLSFIDLQERSAEVDLLLLSNAGFFVVELKGWHGTIAGDQQNWRVTSPGGQVRHERNPFFAAEHKTKRLRSLLEQVQPNRQAAKQVPYVGALVVLHGRGSTVALPGIAATGVVGPRRVRRRGAACDAQPVPHDPACQRPPPDRRPPRHADPHRDPARRVHPDAEEPLRGPVP
jgi:Nuclease-related domain